MIGAVIVSVVILLACVSGEMLLNQDRKCVLWYMRLQDGYAINGRDLVFAGVARRGLVYVVLARLEDEGLVRRRGAMPPFSYELTGRGRVVARDIDRGAA